MEDLSLDTFFYQHPVFRTETFFAFLSKHGSSNLVTQKTILHYHTSKGKIARIKREVYAVVQPGSNSENYPYNAYQIASQLTKDAVLAYHTALELHGLAYSVFEDFTYLASRRLAPLVFRDRNIFYAVSIPKVLVDKHKEDVEITTIKNRELEMRVTTVERTIVDVLDRIDLSGGYEEVWRSLDSIAVFDVEVCIRYALLFDNATLSAKLGFFLSERPESLAVDEKHLKKLEKHIPSKIHYMDRSRKSAGKYIARWNLIVPEEILTRNWDELYES